MNDQSKPDEPFALLEGAASDAVTKALKKNAGFHAVTTLMLSVALVVICVTMIVMACDALGELAGGTWWLAVVYLAVLAIIFLASFFPTGRRLWRAFNQTSERGKLHADWRAAAVDGLNGLDRWRARTITAPLAVLVAVHLVDTGSSSAVATAIAVAGWLSADVITVINSPGFVRLQRIAALYDTDPGDCAEP